MPYIQCKFENLLICNVFILYTTHIIFNRHVLWEGLLKNHSGWQANIEIFNQCRSKLAIRSQKLLGQFKQMVNYSNISTSNLARVSKTHMEIAQYFNICI